MRKGSTYEQLCYLNTRDLMTIRRDLDKILKQRGITRTSYVRPSLLINRSERYLIKNTIEKIGYCESSIPNIIDEDWDYLFTGDYDENRDYYVYYHSNPAFNMTTFRLETYVIRFQGKPFYIGKGKGDRYKSKNRQIGHINRLNKLMSIGHTMDDISRIFVDNLTEKEALILESKMITLLGTKWEIIEREKWITGQQGYLLNSEIPQRPDYYNFYNTDFSKRGDFAKSKKIGINTEEIS